MRHLRYFIAVAEERHFGRAAARLRIAQPGLSQQIKRLEEEVGVTLVQRDKRRVQVTAAGEAFLSYARTALDAAERAVEQARNAATRGGVLRIGSLSLSAYPGLAEAINLLADRCPEIEIDLEPGVIKLAMSALVRREIDVATIFEPFDAPGDVRYRRIGAVEPRVVLSRSHPLADEAAVTRAALLEQTVYAWPRRLNPPLVDHIRRELFGDARPRNLIEAADIGETFAAVGSGDGIAVFGATLAATAPAGLTSRPIVDPPSFHYGAVWLEPVLSPFISILVDAWVEVTARGRYESDGGSQRADGH